MSEEKYLAVNDLVKDLLQRYPSARDNDFILCANVWQRELKRQGMDTAAVKGVDVLKAISDGKVSPVESITRARRKLQEEWPQLRGKRWEARHMKQASVQQELGY